MKSKKRGHILLMLLMQAITGVENFGNTKRHGVLEDTEFACHFRLSVTENIQLSIHKFCTNLCHILVIRTCNFMKYLVQYTNPVPF